MPKEDIENCAFCEMIADRTAVGIIYEDEKLFVIPTLEPVNTGHLLIIPKKHVPYLADLDEDTALHVMKIAIKMSSAIRKSKYKCEGINLFLADGKAAGQEVFHFHLHVYPRFKGDGWGFKYDPNRHLVKMSRSKREEIAKEIIQHL
jgi:histidine triad (HIT) family protein